jgi:hypothetical protein
MGIANLGYSIRKQSAREDFLIAIARQSFSMHFPTFANVGIRNVSCV